MGIDGLKNVIAIVGPTASGKTAVSVELARLVNGEIVSADSMQVYKYMDIGTAKPEISEMKGIRHYLISEITPDQAFSVAQYQELAFRYIDEIIGKSKMPIVVGGTGLYIDSLVKNINYSETGVDWEFRNKMKTLALEKGNEYIHEMLEKIDVEAAKKIHINDTKRIIRALEVYYLTRKNITYHKEKSLLQPARYNFTLFGLEMDRQVLYQRINERVEKMMEKGLLDEVRKLVSMGFKNAITAVQGLGYKEMLWYLEGKLTMVEAVELVKRETRRYAKRQLTWFRKNGDIRWIRVENDTKPDNVAEIIRNYIASYGII